MVGAAGFEPAAPCSQSRCSTRLSYAPSRNFRGLVAVFARSENGQERNKSTTRRIPKLYRSTRRPASACRHRPPLDLRECGARSCGQRSQNCGGAFGRSRSSRSEIVACGPVSGRGVATLSEGSSSSEHALQDTPDNLDRGRTYQYDVPRLAGRTTAKGRKL